MKNLSKNFKKSYVYSGLGLIAIAIIAIILCVIQVSYFSDIIKKETQRYLSEISAHISSIINNKLNDELIMLQSISDTYEILDPEISYDYLKKESSRNNYIRISVIGLDGFAFNTDDPDAHIDFNNLEETKKAFFGVSSVTDILSSPIDEEQGILFIVPRYNSQNQIIGALSGWNSKEKLQRLLNVQSFGDQGFAQIINNKGDFIVNSTNPNAPTGSLNFFEVIRENGSVESGYSLENLQKAMELGKSGVFYFSTNKKLQKVLNYAPLSPKGWYLLSVVPVDVAAQSYQTFMLFGILINVLIAVLFISLIVIIFIMNRKNNLKLKRIAFIDPITDGFSFNRFESEYIKLKNDKTRSYMLISIDILKFKLINDMYGIEKGNLTLKYVHNCIKNYLSADEYVCRFSGDNYIVLIKSSSTEDVLSRLNKISEDINKFNEQLKCKYYLCLACGVYSINDLGLPLIQVIDRADVARRSIKVNGSQLLSCVFYRDLEFIKLYQVKEIENKMESALKNREFVVFLQPKIDLKSNKICGAEALVRWQDPEKGLIGPNDFIPIFEKNGFITQIDLYVFEEVCNIIKNWIDSGIEPLPISVNLSRAHLHNKNFLDDYKNIISKYNIPHELIEIELTETLVFENKEVLALVIDEIHSLGFKCSLDDFGSGYSSLNILKDLPVDTIKLDRGFFICQKCDDKRQKDVIQSIIELTKKLNMVSVSEGIEDEKQVQFLKDIKCDSVQGFIFSAPIPKDKFEVMAFGKVIQD